MRYESRSPGLIALAPAIVALLMSPLINASELGGEQLYAMNCAICHEGQLERAPRRDVMVRMTPASIYRVLTEGRMSSVGAQLSDAEKNVVADYLGKAQAVVDSVDRSVTANQCPSDSVDGSLLGAPRWNGWSVDGANTRFQSTDAARLPVADIGDLELKWAFGFPDEILAYGQPTVAAGRLYVGTQIANVYALDAKSGCAHWSFKAEAGVRTAIVLASLTIDAKIVTAAIFGDQAGNVYAIDARDGSALWKRKLSDHKYAQITGSPVLFEGRVYVPVSSFEEIAAVDPGYECCTFAGSLAALDANTGEVVWHTSMIDEPASVSIAGVSGKKLYGPSGSAIWAAPTIDTERRLVYVVTGDNYTQPTTDTSDAVRAFDLETGQLRWSIQALADDAFNASCITADKKNCPEDAGPDLDLGASPMLVKLYNGERRLFAGQKSGMLYALDPNTDGKELWRLRTSSGGARGGIQWSLASDGHQVFVPVSDWAASEYQPENNEQSDLEGFGREGGMRSIDAQTGRPLWYAPPADCANRDFCSPGHSAAITAIPGAVIGGTLDGRIRIYSSVDGELLWEFDTLRDFETINGVAGKGGAIDGAGPVVVDGMLYVNSGYGRWSSPAGNVLLAFGPKNRE